MKESTSRKLGRVDQVVQQLNETAVLANLPYADGVGDDFHYEAGSIKGLASDLRYKVIRSAVLEEVSERYPLLLPQHYEQIIEKQKFMSGSAVTAVSLILSELDQLGQQSDDQALEIVQNALSRHDKLTVKPTVIEFRTFVFSDGRFHVKHTQSARTIRAFEQVVGLATGQPSGRILDAMVAAENNKYDAPGKIDVSDGVVTSVRAYKNNKFTVTFASAEIAQEVARYLHPKGDTSWSIHMWQTVFSANQGKGSIRPTNYETCLECGLKRRAPAKSLTAYIKLQTLDRVKPGYKPSKTGPYPKAFPAKTDHKINGQRRTIWSDWAY